MKHLMLDAYGAIDSKRLFDVSYLNHSLAEIIDELGLTPIAPTYLLPYDYGLIPNDDGVSAYTLLKGGHITIHTFPYRACYFIDLCTSEAFDETKAKKLLMQHFPFDPVQSRFFNSERGRASFDVQTFDPKLVFGPHVFARFTPKSLTMETAAKALELLIADIGMTPITRAHVLLDHPHHPTYLTGFVMIAESHLSIHYHLATQELFFDIFSCKMFDYAATKALVEKTFGKAVAWSVVARGEKHALTEPKNARKNGAKKSTYDALNRWKKYLNR